MKKALQILGICFITIFFVSLTVNQKTVFSYIYGVISPVTTATQSLAYSVGNKAAYTTKYYTNKLFNNSLPKKKVKDTISSKLAATQKQAAAPLEKVEVKEKEELDELIKSH